jgi:hypothetical protein
MISESHTATAAAVRASASPQFRLPSQAAASEVLTDFAPLRLPPFCERHAANRASIAKWWYSVPLARPGQRGRLMKPGARRCLPSKIKLHWHWRAKALASGPT